MHFAHSRCCSSICLLTGKFEDPCNRVEKFEDACSRMIASNSIATMHMLETKAPQDQFKKLQDQFNKSNVAKRKATQAAQHWQKACLAARAQNNQLTQEIYQLEQEHQKLGEWPAGSAGVPPRPPCKHPKQPACSPPRHPMTKPQTKAHGKGKSKGKDLKGKGKTKAKGYSRQPRMPWATPIGGSL